jgi:thioesterase domain-containing protein
VHQAELYVIHAGGLSASCWSRLATHLPPGTPIRIQELETVNAYWADDPKLTIDAIADRFNAALRPDRPRLFVGWGVGGVVAEALAARAQQRLRRVVVLDSLAPGVRGAEPTEAELLRSFAMYTGARRGRQFSIDPAHFTDGLDNALESILDAAFAAGALRGDTPPATFRRCYDDHVRRVLRDHRLTSRHIPAGLPLTVVKAAGSLAPESRALGWNRYGPTEVLASAGDHYSMLTDPTSATHLALLLQRWLAPAYATA